jgi:hypothetical protein
MTVPYPATTSFAAAISLALLVPVGAGQAGAREAVAERADSGRHGVIDIGSRRELFVDRFLIERLTNVRQALHRRSR